MNKKLVSVILISVFLLSTTSAVFADNDKYYEINIADIFLNVEESGLLNVNESYEYEFHGQYNGVYRNIPLKEGESIDNLKVTADGAYTKVEQYKDGDYYKVKVYLYSDAGHKNPIKDTSVVINYNYNFKGVVNIYNDVGELQYKLWGEEWDQGVNYLVAKIQFPDSQEIKYWINPSNADIEQTWQNNTLTIESANIESGSYLEFRGIIPLSEFNNPIYAYKMNMDGYDEIVNIQENGYEEEESPIATIIPIILACSLIIPVFIYFRYGREPKVDYSGVYEHELPGTEDPIFVDAMFGTKTHTGEVSDNGIQAVIMELIDEDIIKIDESDEDNFKLILPKDYDNLADYKRNIIDLILKPFEVDGKVDFKFMKDRLVFKETAKDFNRKLKEVKQDYQSKYIEPVLDQYFINKGSNLYKKYCVALAAISFILMIYSLMWDDISLKLFISSLVFFIIGCSLWAVPNRIHGRWTEKGMTEYKKWQAFKKFIKDFSLIKQYPPQSIEMWDKYLVYGTALGNAKAVNKAMDAIGPIDNNYYSSVYRYNHLGGPTLLSQAIRTGYTTVNASKNGPGSIGGGSGGGGGGAF